MRETVGVGLIPELAHVLVMFAREHANPGTGQDFDMEVIGVGVTFRGHSYVL